MNIVKQIATIEAGTLNRLRNWELYSTLEVSCDPRMYFTMVDAMKAELATSRARESGRDLDRTLMEVEWEVAIELGKILSGTTNPESVHEQEQPCGICLEDMSKGEEVRAIGAACGHMFHDYCIFEWVKRKPNCPLCRGPMSQILLLEKGLECKLLALVLEED